MSISKLFNLPPFWVSSFKKSTGTIYPLHPLTSLHMAIWEYQKKGAKSTDVELAKRVHILSEQKLEAYRGRFGSVLEFFSSLINWAKIGRWVSCGELGLELSNPILWADEERKLDSLLKGDAKEYKAQMERDLRAIHKSKNPIFAAILSSFIPVDKMENWENLSTHYHLTLTQPIEKMWELNGKPITVTIPEHLDIYYADNGTIFFSNIKFSYDGKKGSITSLHPTKDRNVEAFYTIDGQAKSDTLPYEQFPYTKRNGNTQPVVPAPEAPPPPPPKPFKEEMFDEFMRVWTEPEDQAYVTSCWTNLLKGVKGGKWIVVEAGKRYRLELDHPVTGPLIPDKKESMFEIPSWVKNMMSAAIKLNKSIEITIETDAEGGKSFTFPNGGFFFELTPSGLCIQRPIDKITILPGGSGKISALPIEIPAFICNAAYYANVTVPKKIELGGTYTLEKTILLFDEFDLKGSASA